MTKENQRIVLDVEEPTRLDRYLKRVFPLLTQGIIENHLRKGKIKINGKKVQAGFRVNLNDEILFFDPEIWYYQSRRESVSLDNFPTDVVSLAKKIVSEYLLFENQYFIAINKPCNLAVQGGSKIKISIDDALNYLSLQNQCDYKLVHRLDKETSGILLIAKGYAAANKLTQAFKDRAIQKIYIALLYGKLDKLDGVLRGHISSHLKDNNDMKYAESFFRVIKYVDGNSLVEFRPKTGRMHQLRIHSKMLGHSIMGDKKYGAAHYKRLMLHAKAIQIPREIFGQNIIIEATSQDFDQL